MAVSAERIHYIHIQSHVQRTLNRIMMSECFGSGWDQIIIAVGSELMNDYANVKVVAALTTRLK